MNQDNSDISIHASLMENSPLGIATANLEGKFVSANQAYLEMLGYTLDELKELTFLDVTHPDDRNRNIEYAQKIVNGDITLTQFEKRYIRKGGQTINVKVTTWLLKDKDGNPTTHVSAFEDITEMKKIEHSLEESNMKYRTIFDKASDMMVLHSLESGYLESPIIDVNEQLCLKLRYSKEELLKMITFDLITKGGMYSTIPIFRDSLREHDHATLELEFKTKDDEIIPVEISSHLMKIGGEEVVLSIARDFSERKRFEDELYKTSNELRLYLDILTHDVRNYQASIIGYLDIALSSKNLLEAENYIKKAQANISNTENLLYNASIIMMLKESSGDSLKPLKLLKIVEEAKVYIVDQFPHKTIEIDIEKIDKDTSVIVDHLCQQLFVNLFSNAIKFTAQENVQIKVYQEKSTKGKCAVVIADNAKGIPIEDREKIFERFSEFKRRGKGSGLGLYITQTLVKRYSGRIWVESKVDEDYTKGSKFIVEFNTK